MAVPLPTGVTTDEASAIFAKLQSEADSQRQKHFNERLAMYLLPPATGAALPVGVSQLEFNTITQDMATRAGAYSDNWLVTHTPLYLIPNLPDYVVPTQPEYTNWLATVVAKGGTVSGAQGSAVNTLIANLKTAGIWAKLDRLWLFAAENTAQALTDLKIGAQAVAINSPVFTAAQGYRTDGVASLVRSDIVVTQAVQFTQDDASEGGWLSGLPTFGMSFGHDFGAYSMVLLSGTNSMRWEINSGTNPTGTPTINNPIGLYHSQRRAGLAGGNTSQLLVNGVSTIQSTAPSITFAAGAYNTKYWAAGAYATTTANFTFGNGQYGAMFAGASLSGLEAQFNQLIATYMATVQAVTINRETSLWQSTVVARGGTVSAGRLTAVDKFVTTLKTNGIFQNLDRLWLFAAENIQQAQTDLVVSAGVSLVNAPTFTTNRGYAGNGTTSYIDTLCNPAVASTKYVQNNACLGVWIDTLGAVGTACQMGNDNSGTTRMISNSGPTRTADITGGSGNIGAAPASTIGFFHGQRTSSTAVAMYGAGGGQDAVWSQTSVVAANRTMKILANHNGDFQWSPSRLSAAWMGASLTPAQIDIFEQAIIDYLGAINGIDGNAYWWSQCVLAAGGTVSGPRGILVTNLITSLKAYGIWPLLDRLWLFAAENSQAALTGIISGAQASGVNSPTFTANLGYASNGTTSYIATNYTPAVNGNALQLNSASLGYYCTTNRTTGASTGWGAQRGDIFPKYGDLNVYVGLNGSDTITPAPSSTLGFWHANRPNSTQVVLSINAVPYVTFAQPVTNFATNSLFICGWNNGSAAQYWGTDQVAVAFMGGSLAGKEAAFYNTIRTYLTAVGVP